MSVRTTWVLVVLFALGCSSVLGYSWATRADDPPSPPTEVPIRSVPTVDIVERKEEAPKDSAPSHAVPTVADWIADTSSADPQKRAEAITSLAKAPKPQALPVLKRVLNHGEPLFDRPLAMRALRDLAIAQGDDDGSIQEALRYATYHESDPDLIRGAEAALDAIATQLAANASLNDTAPN